MEIDFFEMNWFWFWNCVFDFDCLYWNWFWLFALKLILIICIEIDFDLQWNWFWLFATWNTPEFPWRAYARWWGARRRQRSECWPKSARDGFRGQSGRRRRQARPTTWAQRAACRTWSAASSASTRPPWRTSCTGATTRAGTLRPQQQLLDGEYRRKDRLPSQFVCTTLRT